jgi:hypothetical protein
MDEQPIAKADLEGLAEKLNAVEFTSRELAIFEAILQAANANAEVEAYGFDVGSLQLVLPQPESSSSKATLTPKFSAGSQLKASLKPSE